MAGTQSVLDVTYEAEEDLSSSQYCAVVAGSADGQCALPSGAGVGDFLGILQNTPESGEAARVRKLGITRAVADTGETGSFGDAIEIADAGGHLRAYTGASDNCAVGQTEEDFASEDHFKMFIYIVDQPAY